MPEWCTIVHTQYVTSWNQITEITFISRQQFAFLFILLYHLGIILGGEIIFKFNHFWLKIKLWRVLWESISPIQILLYNTIILWFIYFNGFSNCLLLDSSETVKPDYPWCESDPHDQFWASSWLLVIAFFVEVYSQVSHSLRALIVDIEKSYHQ